MKILLIIAGIFVVIIATMYVIGLMLPVQHTASIQADIPASTEEVWNRITTIEKYPEWRKEIKKVESISSSQWIEYDKSNNTPYRVAEAIPLQKWVIAIDSKNLPYGGRWTYIITKSADHTHISITEDGEVYNPIFRFISRYVMGHDATMKKYLAELQASF
jgi:hypothetical protein